jgi:hypothetical protein
MAPPTRRTLILRRRATLARRSAKRRVRELAEDVVVSGCDPDIF